MSSNGERRSSGSRLPPAPWQAPATWACLAALVATHLALEFLLGETWRTRAFEVLGLSRAGIGAGRLWQLLSYGLLHGSWWHLGLNTMFLLWMGGRIERITGAGGVLRVLSAGILAGGAAHLVLGEGILIGASGGCVALLLLLATLSPQSRMMPLPVSARNLGRGVLTAELTLALINPALNLPGAAALGRTLVGLGYGSWFHISHACHFGGGLAGWLIGCWILRPRVSLAQLQRARTRREGPPV